MLDLEERKKQLQSFLTLTYDLININKTTFSTSKIVNQVFKKRKRNEKPNHTQQGKYPIPGDDVKQQTELGRAYLQSESKSKENIKHYQSSSWQKVERRP